MISIVVRLAIAALCAKYPFTPNLAHALTCIHPPSYYRLSDNQKLKRRMLYADAVFAARFNGSDEFPSASLSKFEVLRVWKGRVATKEYVKWNTMISQPHAYDVGEVYLVFASGSSGSFSNNIEECDPLIQVPLQNGRVRYPAALGRGRRPKR